MADHKQIDDSELNNVAGAGDNVTIQPKPGSGSKEPFNKETDPITDPVDDEPGGSAGGGDNQDFNMP